VKNRAARGLAAALLLAFAVWPAPATAHRAGKDQRLSKIGPAPEFALTTQHGVRLALADLRGKVVAVTFIYAGCADTYPLLIAKLAGLQDRLGRDFGLRVFFVAITLDPERDTPEVLKRYAESHGARPEGWALLTGTPSEIRDIARRYGVYYRRQERGDVDHTFLTSVVDRSGTLRVQYLGVRFDPNELLKDIQSLLRESPQR
jgi:protein SCO1